MVGWWYFLLARSVVPVVFAWYYYGLPWSDGLVIICVVSVQVPVYGCGAPAVVTFASCVCMRTCFARPIVLRSKVCQCLRDTTRL